MPARKFTWRDCRSFRCWALHDSSDFKRLTDYGSVRLFFDTGLKRSILFLRFKPTRKHIMTSCFNGIRYEGNVAMSKKQRKKRVEIVPVNRYRHIALVSNPLILVLLVILIIIDVPYGTVIFVGFILYAAWAYLFIKAHVKDRKRHNK